MCRCPDDRRRRVAHPPDDLVELSVTASASILPASECWRDPLATACPDTAPVRRTGSARGVQPHFVELLARGGLTPRAKLWASPIRASAASSQKIAHQLQRSLDGKHKQERTLDSTAGSRGSWRARLVAQLAPRYLTTTALDLIWPARTKGPATHGPRVRALQRADSCRARCDSLLSHSEYPIIRVLNTYPYNALS